MAIDSSFASAWRAIGVLLNNSARDPVRMMARERAYALRERLPPRERYVAEASYLRSLGDEAGATVAYRSLLEIYPDDPIVLNNLGLIKAGAGETAKAVEHFRQGMEADSLQPLLYGNLIDVLLELQAMESGR